MNRRTAYNTVVFAWLGIFFFLGYGVWSFQAGHLMIIIYLALSAIAYILYAFRARCARCGMPVLLRPMDLLGMRLYRWSILAPRRCGHCGAQPDQGREASHV